MLKRFRNPSWQKSSTKTRVYKKISQLQKVKCGQIFRFFADGLFQLVFITFKSHVKTIFNCRLCLPENLLLRVGPHVDKLALVVEEERVWGEAVGVDELSPPLLGRQQRRWDHSVRVHFLLLHLRQKR